MPFCHYRAYHKAEFSYTFDHLAQVTQDFADALKLDHYTLYLHDYGGPVEMRMTVAQPEKNRSYHHSKCSFSRRGFVSALGCAPRLLARSRAFCHSGLKELTIFFMLMLF